MEEKMHLVVSEKLGLKLKREVMSRNLRRKADEDKHTLKTLVDEIITNWLKNKSK